MDAVTLDLNGNSLPTMALADVSGLEPLTLPETFLDNRAPSQSGLSSDAVLRFESAMAGTDAGGAETILHSARLVSESFSPVAPEAPTATAAPSTPAPAVAPTSETPAPVAGESALGASEAVPVTAKGPEAVAVPDDTSRISRLVSVAPAPVEETGDAAEDAVQAAPHVVVAAAVPQAVEDIAKEILEHLSKI